MVAENTAIEWADHTFNPWVGCTKVSPGCDHCYAEGWAKRAGKAAGVEWGGERRRTSEANWRKPLQWNDQAQRVGRRFRVFCASLADVFDNQVPPVWRADLFDLINATPHLDWLLLTKRIGNAWKMMADACGVSQLSLKLPLPNVWLGDSVVNQAEADRDVPKLLAVPARVRFLSVEPMLGPIQLGEHGLHGGPGQLDWVICGGESGHGARAMHPDWARNLRDQCAAAGVPFLFKQWGEWLPITQREYEWWRPWYRSNRVARDGEDQAALDDSYGQRCTVPELCLRNDGQHVPLTSPNAFLQGTKPEHAFRIGKKAAGRQLDGRTHDEFPAG